MIVSSSAGASEPSGSWHSVLTELRASTGAAMAFSGGAVPGGHRLEHFSGAQSDALNGLLVRPGLGLGGLAAYEARVLQVLDYTRSRTISHEYDWQVAREGLRTVVAAPVIVDGTVVGILYCGTRGERADGDRLRTAVESGATRLAGSLMAEGGVPREEARLRAALTRTLAEVRQLRSECDDPRWEERLGRLLECLSLETGDTHRLTSRQQDVLSLVATGASYSSVGRRLGLSAQTVKSYMRDVMALMGVHTRSEAVFEARRHGILP